MKTITVADSLGGASDSRDLMEPAEEIPDIKVLQDELDYAWSNDGDTYNQLARWEDIRYCRWEGQHPDGLKHREHMGAKAMPYDGAPDTRIMLADGVINGIVDVLYAAFFGARVKTAPTTARTLNAAQAAEWRAIISWMINGPLRAGLNDDVEFCAQVMLTCGWCVLHTNWRKEKIMRLKRITRDEIFDLAAKAAQQRTNQNPQNANVAMLEQAPDMIMDPEQEDAAIELFQMFFPSIGKQTARRVVRELREDSATEFPIEQDGPNVPELRVLVPGQHFVLPPESTAFPDTARWMPVRVFMSEQMLRQRAQEEDWNKEFVTRVVDTKGLTFNNQTVEAGVDTNMKDIEVIYMYQRRNSDAGVPGLYCTVLSMHVKPDHAGEVTKADYGYHNLVDLAHNQYPFIMQQTEVTGLRPMDARGVPEICYTQQNEMKNSRDLTYVFQQLSTVPPLNKKGSAASKLPPGLSPAGIVNNTNGEWAWFPPPPGKPDVAFKLTEEVRKEIEDYFGVPREDTPGARSQARMQRIVGRWLSKWGEALWQLSVLAYQNLSPQELKEILGRQPLLNADMIAQQRLLLWFEVRAMDNDWLAQFLEQIIKLLQIDLGGTIDRSKLIGLVLAYMDPTLSEEVTMDEAGAKQQIYKEVRDEIGSIMIGNKPMLVQNDPTARMKMQFAQQVVQENPAFAAVAKLVAQLPKGQAQGQQLDFDQSRASNLKTYMENLQHSYQEMVVSKQQGRLGVADVGNAPVKQGGE